MTKEEQEESDRAKAALQALDEALDSFTKDVREVIHRKLHDSISVEEVLEGRNVFGQHDRPALAAQRIMLLWVRKMLLETLFDDFGPERVEREFVQIFWQINGQQLGTDSFDSTLTPLRIQQEDDARKLAANTQAEQEGKWLPYPQFKPKTVQPYESKLDEV